MKAYIGALGRDPKTFVDKRVKIIQRNNLFFLNYSQASTESGLSTSPVTATPPPPPGIPYNSVAAGNRSTSASKALTISRASSEAAASSSKFF